MDHPAVAGALVQIINILGDQQKMVAQQILQTRQRQMRRVRRDFRTLQLTTTGVVERLHQRRIAGEAFRRRHIFHPMLFHRPSAARKVLIPDSAEMPAPVNTTTLGLPSLQASSCPP